MDQQKTVQFFMEKGLCESAQSGQHNFINKVAGTAARVFEANTAAKIYCNGGVIDSTKATGSDLSLATRGKC